MNRFRNLRVVALLMMVAMLAAPLSARAGSITSGTPVQVSHSFVTGQPPAAHFRGNTKGDGWGLAVTSDRVFNVFHHQGHFTVDCHLTANAVECPHYPSLVSDGVRGFSTPMDATLWVIPSLHRLYSFAYQISTRSAGVVCMKIDEPQTPFCGFTKLSKDDQAGHATGYSLISNAVTVGKRHYAINGIVGVNTDTRNALMCFDDLTQSACADQPFRVPLGSTSLVRPNRAVTQLTGVAGRVIITSTGLDRVEKVACFDGVTLQECAGLWPIHLPDGARPVSSPPLPKLDTHGFGIGICFEGPEMPCVDLDGDHVATPPGLVQAINPRTVEDFNGEPSVVGSRVYVAIANFRNYSDNKVACYDFASQTNCPNFPFRPTNLNLIYTTNQDPQVPSCIWLNADSGASQIQNFDAYTTRNCGATSQRVMTASFIETQAECAATSYQTLTVTSPAPGTYINGTVTFENGNGDPLPGVAVQHLDANGQIDLSGLALETHPRFVQFAVSLPGAQQQPIALSLDWASRYHDDCVLRGQIATALPPTTTTSLPTSSTTTSVPSSTTTSTLPVLPRTGSSAKLILLMGMGAVIIGVALMAASRQRNDA